MLQQSKRPCDAQRAEGAWPKRIRGSVAKWRRLQADPLMLSRRSTSAERIPEGTKREHGVSVEEVDSRRGTDNRLGTASRGSNRDVAISDDHEL